MVAVLSLSLLTAPPDALAKGKKVPPGQAKKINFKVMNDVRNHWAVEPVTALQKEGIIKGYDDGNYYPQNNVSRSESLVMVMRALNLEGGNPSKKALKAAADCPDWARGTVALAIDKGIITEQEAEDLDFSKPALRYEVAVWLGRAQNSNISTGNLTFADSGKIPGYAKKYVAFMAQNKVINGYPGNMFGPQNSVKRAEIASMLFRCQNVFSLNNQFASVSGEVKDVNLSDPASIVLAAGNGYNAGETEIQVADDAAIFVEGDAAELGDINEGDSVTVVLNPARKAIVVLVNDGVNNNSGDEDSNAPEITTLSPKDSKGDVESGLKQLVATFDENIQPVKSKSDVASKIKITNETDNKAVKINYVTISDKKLNIYLVDGLEADCEYTVYMPSDIIEDEDGNNFDGISGSNWNFTTDGEQDNTDPEIDSLDPEDEDDVVGNVHEITATFDENVQWSDGDEDNADKIVIYNDGNKLTPEDIELNDNELVIKFDEALAEGGYVVIIPSGVIEDEAGNSFNGLSNWNFEIQ